uniref:leucine-rich repeat-containing protein 23 isoform X2 n=1 Tax=Jaculus jaculus TaxID=51337 RepID=UPI001E1B6015|nr:leucine-rich repeat-containing protein 23 isoform X2 [Jaculus jaculus]
MSDEDDLDDVEPDQDDLEKDEDEKDTEEWEDKREGEEFSEEWMPTPLTENLMKEGLSLLCKTGNGLAHAYVKLELKDRDLTDIYLLRSYIHLRYVDVSENHLTDLSPLSCLTHLLWLKADGNQLQSAGLKELPYLQIASFAYNQITDTEGICHPRLESLDLKGPEHAEECGRFGEPKQPHHLASSRQPDHNSERLLQRDELTAVPQLEGQYGGRPWRVGQAAGPAQASSLDSDGQPLHGGDRLPPGSPGADSTPRAPGQGLLRGRGPGRGGRDPSEAEGRAGAGA